MRALSASIVAKATTGAWRRGPSLFQQVALDAQLAILFPEPGQLLALFFHQPVLAFRPLGTGPAGPTDRARRPSGQARGRRRPRSCLRPKTNRTAPASNSSENRRRARRPPLSDRIRDIVSTFREMSTGSDQAQSKGRAMETTLCGSLGPVHPLGVEDDNFRLRPRVLAQDGVQVSRSRGTIVKAGGTAR
jgi:hypothetical protein